MRSLSCLFSFGLLCCGQAASMRRTMATPAVDVSVPTWPLQHRQLLFSAVPSSTSSRLDFLGSKPSPEAIIVAKGLEGAGWPELVSGCPSDQCQGFFFLPEARENICGAGSAHSHEPHLSIPRKFIRETVSSRRLWGHHTFSCKLLQIYFLHISVFSVFSIFYLKK